MLTDIDWEIDQHTIWKTYIKATIRLAMACCLVDALAANAINVAAQAVMIIVSRNIRYVCHSGTKPEEQ